MVGEHTDKLHARKKHRLKFYDYSKGGYYFITICTQNKKKLFWHVGTIHGHSQETLPLSTIGKIVDEEINKINDIYENVEINKYVIMPNHVHMIIVLQDVSFEDESGRSKTAPAIGRIVQQFKGSITKQVGFPLWQKSFYDHVIRNEHGYLEIWKYIDENPLKWADDEYYFE